jgi:leucyl-tRNA synthetase
VDRANIAACAATAQHGRDVRLGARGGLCDPEYYKWTQWFFLKLYDTAWPTARFAPVDWCPNCNTTLAREQVWGDDRHCERCGTPVIKKDLDQWFFRITLRR